MPVTHEIWLKTDLKRPITVQTLHGLLFSADNQGDKVGFEVYEDGVPVTLSGVITGYIIKANNETVVVSGSFDGNRAWIVCPANAYDAIGPIYIAIKNRASAATTAVTTTLGMCTTYVQRTATGDIVTPTYKIIDVATIASMITQMETATMAANTAATNANNKASAANTAAASANEKASLANTAATNANTAKDNANAAADAANAAAAAAPTTITQQETAYANSASGTTVPADGWQSSQPTTPQGQYLWIRKTLTWDNGQTTTLYSVSRMGIDGSGSVSSVNSLSPDANGNVDLGDIVHTVNGTAPDSAGNVALGSLVKQVNSVSPDSSGNVALPIDDAPTAGSDNPVKSGALETIISGINAYKPGEIYSAPYDMVACGHITNGVRNIQIGLWLPKSLENINSISVTNLVGAARGVNGYINGWTGNTDILTQSGLTITAAKTSPNGVRLSIQSNSDYTNAVANTPVAFSGKITLSFS